MGLIQNLAVIALFTGAYISNPDERTFRQYVDKEVRKDGSTWLGRKAVSRVASNMYKRESYYFFSLVRLPEDQLLFLGIFGNWFHLSPVSLPSSTSSK